MTHPPLLRVYLLGRFQVVVGQTVIAPSVWRLRAAAAIVKLLALAPGHRLHREQLMDALWPDLEPNAAANNLRYSLFVARRGLAHPASTTPFLQRDGELLVLGPSELVWTDVSAFEEAVADAWHSHDPDPYQRAIGLYVGDLLPEDMFEEWAASRRTAPRASYLATLGRLAEVYEERGELERAVGTLQRLLEAEPIQESVHVRLMQLYALAGHRQRARAQYDRLVTILDDELDAEPDPVTRDLMEAIADGRFHDEPGAARLGAAHGAPSSHGTSPSLPAPLTDLIGREREIAELRQMLASTRLVTLTGAGGIGKTRLATAVAHELMDTFPEGVALVPLASLRDASLVISAVAQSLEIRQHGDRALDELVGAHLRDKRMLLVLDNFEHVVDAAPVLTDLLERCPHLKMMVTSRTRLRLRGEQEFPVAPLRYPDRTARPLTMPLAHYPAVALFARRAQEVQPTFEITPDNTPAVTAICQRLNGLPLAIELAAARSKILVPAAILARLDQPLAFLTGGPRDAPERQQTMRNTIQWSYALLSAEEQRLLHQLSVFAGGWTLEAAEAVVNPANALPIGVLDGLMSLVDKSLVNRFDQADGAPRFSLLEPIREFAMERLQASGEMAASHNRHAEYFAELPQPTADKLEGPQAGAWLDLLETEHDNFRAALRWATASGATEHGQRLAGGLAEFWFARGYLSEGRRWLEELLRAGDGAETAVRAAVLRGVGEMARGQGDLEVARRMLGESAALFHKLNKEQEVARTINRLGVLAMSLDDMQQAHHYYEESHAISERIGDQLGAARALGNLAIVLIHQGDQQRARQLLESIVPLYRRAGYQRGLAVVLGILAGAAHEQGDNHQALAWTEESLTLAQSMDEKLMVSQLLGHLGELSYTIGDHEGARRRLAESLAMSQEQGSKPKIARAIRLLGQVAQASSQPRRAALLFGAAEVLREHVSWNAASPISRRLYEQSLAELRATLEAVELAGAWAEGKRMSLDEAVAYALSNGGGERAGHSNGLR
jgi:predicted ATPase/DNA-binding SARP family transcriptional activator